MRAWTFTRSAAFCLRALTGTVPYAREGHAARIYAHLKAPPPTVSDCATGIPQRFDGVISRALAKCPDDRFPSAGDLGFAAVAVSEERSVARAERSVATGEAAPGRHYDRVLSPDRAPENDPEAPTTAPAVPEGVEIVASTELPRAMRAGPEPTRRRSDSGRTGNRRGLALVALSLVLLAAVAAGLLVGGVFSSAANAYLDRRGEDGHSICLIVGHIELFRSNVRARRHCLYHVAVAAEWRSGRHVPEWRCGRPPDDQLRSGSEHPSRLHKRWARQRSQSGTTP